MTKVHLPLPVQQMNWKEELMKSEKSRVTLKDIALRCGYSVNTVSRALRGDTRLPKATLEKIQAAADEAGYVRNNLASSLRSGKTNIIAIMIEEVQNQHYSYLVNQLGLLLNEHGYYVMILSNAMEDVSEEQLAAFAISNAVDGVLFFPRSGSRKSADLLQNNHIPMVLVDREIDKFDADVVRLDDYQGGFLAGIQLARASHQKLCYLAGPPSNGSQKLRQEGFLDALAESGITRKEIRIVSHTDIMGAIRYNALGNLLLPLDYTAVFSFNDEIAYYVMTFFRESGIRVPEDISLIGFDNIRLRFPYLLPLSTIAEDSGYSMAQIAVRLLLERIQNPDLPVRKEILPVRYYEGGTVKRHKPSL